MWALMTCRTMVQDPGNNLLTVKIEDARPISNCRWVFIERPIMSVTIYYRLMHCPLKTNVI